jgi:hypothetical protein
MLLQRRDRLRIEEIRDALQQAADRIANALGGGDKGAPGPSVEAEPETPMTMPDPFEQDLTPWLVRRLQLAAGLAHGLRTEADLVR